MSVIRRSMIAFFAAAAMPVAAFAAAAPVPALTEDELLMISAMKDYGTQDFLLLNEQQGLLKLIRSGRVELVSPAASGAVKGDNTHKDARVTPAGIFPLTDFNDGQYIKYYSIGHEGYFIHPTTPRRDSLLAEKNPNKFRASDGCIAVPRPVFAAIRHFLSQSSKPTLVVLPEERSVRSMLGLNPKEGPQ